MLKNSRDKTSQTCFVVKTKRDSNSTCVRIERSYICGCNRGFQSAKDNGTDCAGSGFQMNI